MRLVNYPSMKENQMMSMEPCAPDVRRMVVEGKNFLYDANSMALWECTDENVYNEIDENTIGISAKPYVPGDIRDLCHKMLVFQTTYACNLKCRYCFVREHYLVEENKLSLSDCLRALDTFQSARFQIQTPDGKKIWQQPPYKLSFFGGEPLLNWQLIYQVTEEVKKRCEASKGVIQGPKPYALHITSNGTLITEEIAEYTAKHGFSWIISIDGKESAHDNNRQYAKGGGSWNDAMRGLEYLVFAYRKLYGNNKVFEMPITLRSTFDSKEVALVEKLEFLNSLMYRGFAGHVSVEPASLGEGCAVSGTIEKLNTEEITALLAHEYKQAAVWFLAELQAGRKPSFHHFEMPLQRIYDRAPAFSECGAGKGYVSIGPGGKISACHRENCAEIGHLETGIDQTKQARWMDNRYFTRKSCPECWCRNICGGGCRHDSLQDGNEIGDPCKSECTIKDIYTTQVIWLLSQMSEKQKQKYSARTQEDARQHQRKMKEQGILVTPAQQQQQAQQQPERCKCGKEDCSDK